ncbi:MAG: hypothetical protein WC343_00190 [Bacilli bacterium]|jgi:hypothetical protein
MTSSELIEKLKRAGGNEWQAGDHHRIYFNDLEDLYGLETTRYKTGNISTASLRGESISNNKARQISYALRYGKLYYDLVEGSWGSREIPESIDDELIEIIRRKAGLTEEEE